MKITNIPSKEPTRVIDFQRLDGGLNLWELDYRLSGNQSPDMKNLWWQDGVLQCRDGQSYIHGPDRLVAEETGDLYDDPDWADLGTGYTCSQTLFWDNAFFHIGSKLYRMDVSGIEHRMMEVTSGIPENRGTFFRYNEYLYYKNRGGFFKIAHSPDGDGSFTASRVQDSAYTPVIQLNTDPRTGAGDTYQPENRLSASKTVRFNAADGVTKYQLPVKNVDEIRAVTVDGRQLSTDEYSADLTGGTVTFTSAPPVQNPAVNNTVEITFSKENPDALNAILDCPYATVYSGGGNMVCMVLGGSEKQPNAFFWNGNDDLGMNDTYWPITFYQLAGDAKDGVTGFGIQYGTLLVLKEKSVGKAAMAIERVDDRDSILLTYEEINSKIGCDLPWTIQLIENNVVFCNTSGGVCMVRESTSALENNIVNISRNVNGTDQRHGLLIAVKFADPSTVCAFDDDNRYWICVDGKVYLWDYLLSSWKDPSWFYFDSVPGIAYFRDADTSYHLDGRGRVTKFQRGFMDYDGPIDKVYQFPPQFFGTYDRLKDVQYVLLSVRSDTDSEISILYQSDYETRYDPTKIQSRSWKLAPRNLSFRFLGVQKFAYVAKRSPGCRHVRHFSMRLTNNNVAQDLAILSAQIYFRYTGRDR